MYEVESEDELQSLKDAGFTDDEISQHLEQASNVETITIEENAPVNPDANADQAHDLVTKLQNAGFEPDEIAEHIRESGLAAPGSPDLTQNDSVTQPIPNESVDLTDQPGSPELTPEMIEGAKAAQADGLPRAEILSELKSMGASDEAYELLGYETPKVSALKMREASDLEKFKQNLTPTVHFGLQLGFTPEQINKVPKVLQEAINNSPSLAASTQLFVDAHSAKTGAYSYQQTLAAYNNAYETYGLLTKSFADSMGILDEKQQQLLNNAQRNLNNGRVDALANLGYSAYMNDSNQLVIEREDGSTQPVDTTFMRSLLASKHAAVLTGVGEEVGRRAAKGRIKSKVGVVVAATTGAAGGAFAGKYLDLLTDATVLQEKFSDEFKFRSALDEAGAAAVFVPVATGVLRGLKGTVSLSKDVVSGAADKIIEKQAQKALIETNYILPEEGTRLIEAAQAKGIALAGATEMQKSIAAQVLNTGKDSKFRAVVDSAVGLADTTQVSGLLDVVNQRARHIMGSVKNLSKDTDPQTLATKYLDYEKATSEVYGLAKADAINRTKGFTFEINEELLEPLEKTLSIGLQDMTKSSKFAGFLRQLEITRTTKDTEGLLDLLPAVNKAMKTKNIAYKDKQALRELKGTIMNSVHHGISTMDSPEAADAWTKGFRKANEFYKTMMDNRSNAVAKVLRKPGVKRETIESVITGHINNPDVLNEAFRGLPLSAVKQAESIYFSKMLQKFEITKASEASLDSSVLHAIDFHKLGQAIQNIKPRSADGKQLAHEIRQYATMFRADPSTGQFANALTRKEGSAIFHTEADKAAKASFIRSSFNAAHKYMPTQGGRSAALINVTSKLLHSPLDAKAVSTAIRIMPEEAKQPFMEALEALQQQFIKSGAKPAATIRGTTSGGYHDTPLGGGKVSTIASGKGLEFSSQGMFDVSQMKHSDILDLLDKPSTLLDKGFTSLVTKDRIYMLDELPSRKEFQV